MTKYNRIQNAINHLEEILMVTFLGVMTVLTSLQVLLRYVFNTGLIWSLEATTYSFAWLVLIGMSYCVRSRTHIALDLMVKRFNPRLRRLTGMLAILVCLAYSLSMLYGSSVFIQKLYMLGHDARDLPFARWLLTIILPIGFGLLTLRFFQLGLAIWRGEIKGLGMAENTTASLQDDLDSLKADTQSDEKPGGSAQ